MNEVRSQIKKDFAENVPALFLDQINKACKDFKFHLEDFENIIYFLDLIRTSMPAEYWGKYGGTVDNSGMEEFLCGEEMNDRRDMGFHIPSYSDGVIENTALYFEKELGEVVYTTLGAAYRSSLVNLRHMLQLSCWMTQGIFDKAVLSGEGKDHGKGMSLSEFENFLHKNNESITKKKSNVVPKAEKRNIHSVNGLTLFGRPEEFLSALRYGELKGRVAIQALYGDLSLYAHSSIWERVDYESESEPFFPEHSFEEFHGTLNYVFKTADLILCLLLIAAFEELSSHSKSRASDFLTIFSSEFTAVDRPKLTNVIPVLEVLKSKLSLEEVKADRNLIEKFADDKVLCSKCKTSVYEFDEECAECGKKIESLDDLVFEDD